MVPMRWLESIALQHKLGILKTVCLEILRKQEEIYPSAIIEHKRNGYLAEYMSVEDLAEGIVWCLKHRNEISDEYLRKTVKDRYDISVVAEKYVNLYKTLNTKENENTVN